MLINCPECGKEISDKSDKCINCGFPLTQYKKEENGLPKRRCINCGHENPLAATQCSNCRKSFEYGGSFTVNPVKNDRELFEKRYNTPCCPQCGSRNYHAFVEEVVLREGKTKTKTSLNLNPLKPFTLFNHKEKVVRKPITTQVSRFICDDCGKIFN